MSSRRGNLVSAFDLVPVVEQLPPDKQVECLCAWEKTLYIGTSDASILYYSLVDGKSPLGKTIYQSKLRVRKQLDADRRKTLQQLTLIPSMNRILAQLDGTIYVLDMQRLEVIDTRDRITKVVCYCIDEGRSPHSSSCEIIVAQQKRKSLLMYTYNNGDRFVAGRDIPLPDQPVAMARDGNSVCVAISSQHFDAGRYLLINLADSGSAIELPPYEIGISPLVKRTAKDEFLINTGVIGVIVSSEGTSNCPPIEWRLRRPHAAGYQFPYVVTWSKDTNSLHVFSLMDQQRKQDITFSNGKCLGQFHGKVYAAVNTSVYLLALVPLKEQVTRLFEQQYVEEAILLAETIAAVEESKNPDKADEYIGSVKQQAAFLYFSQGQFSKAETLLLEGNTDPREIISKFEGLLPTSSTYHQQIEMASAEDLANDGKINMKEAKKFLIRYLKEIRTTAVALGRKEEVDTVLVKLLAEDNPSSLINYIEHHELYLNFEDARVAFEKNQCYFALGLLYYYNGNVDTALQIWTRIYDGKLSDDQFPGLDHIVKFLTSFIDNDLLLKYSKWVLDHDELKGVKIFIDRLGKDKGRVQLEHSIVLEKLSPYVQASLLYLEHLIHELELKDEVFHTRLGMLYLEKVLKLKEEKNTKHLKEARAKLQSFLEESSSYRASFLLNRVQDTDLYKECAILYGRMDEHEKALSILAHHLQDYEGAERYCSIYTKGRSRQDRQRVYQTLLTVYLRPSDSSKPPLIKQALKLLNTHGEEFDAAKVLQILPSQWEISTVKDFLVRSIRSTTNAGRTSKIEHSLAKGENLQTKFELMKLQEGPVKITDTRVCPVCQLPFTEATAFVRYPNGIVTHLKCGRNKNICPITGTWFSEY